MTTAVAVKSQSEPEKAPEEGMSVTWVPAEGPNAFLINHYIQTYGRGPFTVAFARQHDGMGWLVKLKNSTGVLQHKNVRRAQRGAEREFTWGILRRV